MTRVALLLFALIAAFATGAWGASRARRASERGALAPRRVRPPAVEAALTAWEEGSEPPPAASQAPDPDLDAESIADLALVGAAVSADDRALVDMARRHDGRDASARALWILVERAPDPATRALRRRAFADRWPTAWVLGAPHGSP